MASTQALLDALHETLAGALAGPLSNRIHDTEAPADSGLPLLIYRIDGHPTDGGFDGVRLNLHVTIELAGPRRAGVKALRQIHDAVFDALHGQTLDATGCHHAEALCLDRAGRVDIRDDAYLMRSTWRIFADPD